MRGQASSDLLALLLAQKINSDLPPSVGWYRGRLIIAVGLAIARPASLEGLGPIAPPAKVARALAQGTPVTLNLIGGPLANRPLNDITRFAEIWEETQDLAVALGTPGMVREVFAGLIERQLSKALETMTAHRDELDPLFNRKSKVKVRSSVCDLFRDHRRLMDATILHGSTVSDWAVNARLEVIATHQKRYKGSPFSLAEEATTVRLRGRVTVAEAVVRASNLDKQAYDTCMNYANRDASDPEDLDLENYDPRDYPRPGKEMSAELVEQSRLVPITLGIAGQISNVELEMAAYQCRSMETPEQALICGIIALGVSVRTLFTCRLRQVNSDWYTATYKVGNPNKVPTRSRDIYERRIGEIKVLVTRRVAQALGKIIRLRKRRKNVIKAANEFLKSIDPNLTLNAIEVALRAHASSWYPPVPQIFLEAGGSPGVKKGSKHHSSRSYVFTSPSRATDMLPLLRLIEPSASNPPMLEGLGWGAATCLKTCEPQDLFSNLLWFLDANLPDDELGLICHANAVTALGHLGHHLFTGIRNYGVVPPYVAQIENRSVEWLQQKGFPSFLYFPQPLIDLLTRVTKFWPAWQEKARQSIPWLGEISDGRCYRLIPWVETSSDETGVRAIFHRDIAEIFFAIPRLQRWRFMNRNALRSWCNSFLRASGFNENDAAYNFHHSPGMLHCCRKHRAEPPVVPQPREAMALSMARRLGLS